MLEVEAKARIADREVLLARLGPPERTERQRDVYYDHPARSFAATDEALRIRTAAGRTELTYKGPKMNARTKTREETTVGIESAPEAHRLLVALGFAPVAAVEKTRRTWSRGALEIALDDVAGLGPFVEVEHRGAGAPEARIAEVLAAIADLAAGPPERRSYLELLLADSPLRGPPAQTVSAEDAFTPPRDGY